MAPNNERSSENQQSHEEDNPFIAFRRYADEQMASLLHSFIGLPSSFSPPNRSLRWRPYDDEARRKARDNWYASAQNDEGKSGWRPEAERDGSVNPESDSNPYGTPVRKSVECRAKDTDAFEAAVCPYRPYQHQPRNMLQPAQILLPWPVNYMLYSPYSPYHLERDEKTQVYGSRWRNAFEELLGYDGGDAEPEETKRSNSEDHPSPLRLQDESDPVSLPDIMRHLREWAIDRSRGHDPWFDPLVSRQREHDTGQDEMTELDLYERLLNRKRPESDDTLIPIINPPKATEATIPDAHEGSSQANESGTLGIISTLTSTERVTLPDGTVHTKVMLKKRFADGREESSETVHTTQGGVQQYGSNLAIASGTTDSTESANAQSDDQKGANPRSGRRGWFWS